MEIKISDELINNRYNTLIKNIKNSSNSFYDSYLDLLECTIKYLLDKYSVKYNTSSTCGAIIKEKQVKEFFFEILKIDHCTYEKLPDYIKKCNDHKHKKEKNLSLESIINYLKIYFKILNYYYILIGEEPIEYDEKYFVSIYNESEKVNKQYKDKINQLNEEIEKLYNDKQLTEKQYEQCVEMLSLKDLEKFDLEKQNSYLEKQIQIILDIKSNIKLEQKIDELEKKYEKTTKYFNSLDQKQSYINQQNSQAEFNNFLIMATKSYIWFSPHELSKVKRMILYSGLINLLSCIIITILSTICMGFYTTYSFFENIYSIFMIFILFRLLKYKKEMDNFKLEAISSFKYKINNIGLFYSNNKEKKSYKIFRILAYISSIANIIMNFKFSFLNLVIIFFEIIYFATLIINSYFKKELHYGFTFMVKFTGKQHNINNIVSIVYNNLDNKYYENNEFIKKYKNFIKND